MNSFYNLVFYLCYRFYAGKEKGAQSTGAAIVGGLQAANLLTFFMLLSIVSPALGFLRSKITAVVVFVFFQITTYIKYIYKDNTIIFDTERNLDAMDYKRNKQKKNAVTLYIWGTVLTSFLTAVFVHNIKSQ